VAAVKMYGMLDESERLAATLPPELRDVIQPVWQMLQQVCQRSASQLSQNGSRW